MALYNKYSLKKCHCLDEINNYLSYFQTHLIPNPYLYLNIKKAVAL